MCTVPVICYELLLVKNSYLSPLPLPTQFLSAEADMYVSFLYTLPEEFYNKKACKYSIMHTQKHTSFEEQGGAARCKPHVDKDPI